MNAVPQCQKCPYNTPKSRGGYGYTCNGYTQREFGRCPDWRISERKKEDSMAKKHKRVKKENVMEEQISGQEGTRPEQDEERGMAVYKAPEWKQQEFLPPAKRPIVDRTGLLDVAVETWPQAVKEAFLVAWWDMYPNNYSILHTKHNGLGVMMIESLRTSSPVRYVRVKKEAFEPYE